MKKAFHRLIASCVFVMSVMIYPTFSEAQAPAASPIRLTFVSYTPVTGHHFLHWKPFFIDAVNAEAKGRLVIEIRGGPEVMSISDMAKATATGVVDMAVASTLNFADLVPGADLIKLSELTWQEENARGLHTYLEELYAKAGLKFLSRMFPINRNYFRICLRKQITTVEGFKGIRLGGPPPVHGAFAAIGAVPVRMVIPEYYTGIDRGLVDGTIYGGGVYVENALFEVAPFVIDNPFFRPTAMLFMNLKRWQALPKDLQDLILRVRDNMMKNYESEGYVKWERGMRLAAEAKGATFYTLPPDVASWYVRTLNEGTWKSDSPKYPADVVKRIRSLVTR